MSPARKADELALAEYQQIKSEQVARIGFRDNLMYVTLVAIAGTLTIAHSAHSRGYLLLVPAVAFVLGWTYLANDNMITAIGRYVREHPALSPMRWETDHPADKRRVSRKTIQLAVDLATFCGSGLTALTAFWLAPDPQSPFLVLGSAIEAIATGVLAWQFATYADVPLTRRAPHKTGACHREPRTGLTATSGTVSGDHPRPPGRPIPTPSTRARGRHPKEGSTPS